MRGTLNSASFDLDTIHHVDFPEVATLIYRSLVHWYESRLRQGARFGDQPAPFQIFPQVYEALDPGESIVAREQGSSRILGVCFVHPRETHFAVGIVATLPDVAGRGVARAMMLEALQRACAVEKPVRLVSSLQNLDSYSLYSKLGFVPREIFQDLLITVPEDGIDSPAPVGLEHIRTAHRNEAARLADFEASLRGIRREKDYQFFLNNEVGSWHTWVSEDASGSLKGVLTVSKNPAMPMLGPGIVADDTTAIAMVWHALNNLRGKSYVILSPATASSLMMQLYRWGARNIELHVSQGYGEASSEKGIVFPTFLPESA